MNKARLTGQTLLFAALFGILVIGLTSAASASYQAQAIYKSMPTLSIISSIMNWVSNLFGFSNTGVSTPPSALGYYHNLTTIPHNTINTTTIRNTTTTTSITSTTLRTTLPSSTTTKRTTSTIGYNSNNNFNIPTTVSSGPLSSVSNFFSKLFGFS